MKISKLLTLLSTYCVAFTEMGPVTEDITVVAGMDETVGLFIAVL